MSLVFEKLSQQLVANQQWVSKIAGDYFRVSVCTYPVTVSILKDGIIVGKMANVLAGDYIKDFDFDGVQIDNGSNAQTVEMQIAGGGVGTDRVLGEVSVINGELSRVKSNNCFICVGFAGQVVGQYSKVQLWNSVGSGKNLIVNKVSVWGNVVPGGIGIVKSIAQLSTPNGVGTSKLLSGADSSAGSLYKENSASIAGTQIANFAVSNANDSKDFNFSEPLIIPPGFGVYAYASNQNTSFFTTFQWNEESI